MGQTDVTVTRPRSTASDATRRRVEFDYLKAAVVVLVVWHHAVLAYVTWAELNLDEPIETVSPVVDDAGWIGFDLLVGLNDTFFMSVMFFISGLFVWASLRRKGVRRFLRDRLVRLGIPFVVGVLALMPLAYYPAQLTVQRTQGGDVSLWTFWSDMAGSGFGTAGPLWFVWVLMLFAGLAAAVFSVVGRPDPDHRRRPDDHQTDRQWRHRLFTSQTRFFGLLVAMTSVTFLAMAIVFDPDDWIGVGPFDAQISRLLMYLAYFLTGTAAGAYGLDRGLLAPRSALGRRWWLWLVGGLVTYAGLIVVAEEQVESLTAALLFILTCSLLVVGSLAGFLRFATRPTRVLDSLAANAYGIYIVHYLFVTWLQYWLLPTDLSAVAKAALVFVGALVLSWGSTAALRRIPLVSRVI